MTTQIPSCPLPPESPKKKSGKKIEFDNPEKHQTKQKLHQEIRQTLLDLRTILPYANHREIVMNFIGAINPGSMGGDVTRLPYEAQRPYARTASKSECLFALISWVIQLYWEYCINENTVGNNLEIRASLGELQQITKNGLKQYQVVGNVRDGFRLERI